MTGRLFSADRFRASLKGAAAGRNLHYFDSVVSTSLAARQLYGVSGRTDFVAAAKVQTGGFGKYGRKWESPEGGLWFSFPAKVKKRAVPLFTLAAGRALAGYFIKRHGVGLQIKWPNDLVYDGKKVCGILTEVLETKKTYSVLLCGVGLNLNNTRFQFPPALRGSVTSVGLITGKKYDPAVTLGGLLNDLDAAGKNADPEELAESLNRLSYSSGREVRIRRGEDLIKGVFRSITPEGCALIDAEGKEYRITGDLEYL